jgi:nondiscriminating aspartyl-tRNA synthetase
MQRIYANELLQYANQTVQLRWQLHTLRLVWSGLAFLILRDRTGLAQIVLENADEIAKLHGCLMGSVIYVEGRVEEAPKSKFGAEIKEPTITVIRKIEHASPIDISKDTISAEPETIHDNKVIVLRHPRYTQIFQVAALVEKHIRWFFDSHNFTQINSPKLIWFPTEWGAEIFELQYFDKKAYLAQSPQFYKQIMVPVFERVYEIGRAYRAEKSNTSRHMSEILMVDAEMWYIDSFNDVLQTAEAFITYVLANTWNDTSDVIEKLWAEKPLIPSSIPRYTLAKVHELYTAKTWNDTTKELDLLPAEEQFICEYAKEHDNSDVVFVTEFPWSDAKFYHYQNPENPETTDRADLLFRWVELATITRREVHYDTLVQQMKDRDINPENPWLKHYLDAFKYGMPDSGWRGFGVARCVQKLLNLSNAKDAELFPRDTQRVTP